MVSRRIACTHPDGTKVVLHRVHTDVAKLLAELFKQNTTGLNSTDPTFNFYPKRFNNLINRQWRRDVSALWFEIGKFKKIK